MMSGDVLCSPASRTWLDSSRAQCSLFTPGFPFATHSLSHSPEGGWTFGCHASKKGCSCSHPGDGLLLGTDGKHQPPSAQHGAAILHCACNQSPTFRTRNLSWGCARGRRPSGADLPFSWDLPHVWGTGGCWDGCCGHTIRTAPRAPLQSAVPWSSSPLSCLRGTGSQRPPQCSSSSPVGHKVGARVPVLWAVTSFCTGRVWKALDDAPIALQLGKSKGWSACSAQDCTRGTS